VSADQVLAALRDLAARRHDAALAEERRAFTPGVVLELGRLGVFGLLAPRDAGGLGLSRLEALRVIEQLGAIDPSLGALAGAHQALGLGPIQRHATAAVRDRLVPTLASGRGIASFVSGVTAIAAGPGTWRLSGRAWSISPRGAAALVVVARGADGVHAFALPGGARGVRVGADLVAWGLRALPQARVVFDDVAVEEAQLLGAPSRGGAISDEARAHLHLGVIALCTGAMKRAAGLALRGVERLDAATEVRLSEIARSLAALSALWSSLARAADMGAALSSDLHLAGRIAAPALACEAIAGASQLLGRRGCLEAEELPRLRRGAEVLSAGSLRRAEILGARLSHGALLGDLRVAWRAVDVADAIEEASRALAGAPAAQRDAELGELGAAAALLAATRAAHVDEDVLAWAEARFVDRRRAILDGRARATGRLSATELAARLGSVGDFVRGGPAEIWQPDRWIRAEAMVSRAPSSGGGDAAATSAESAAHARLREVARAFLAERLDRPAETIPSDLPLTQLGLDSVLAVELAYRLEQEIGAPVDPAAVWAFPTLDTLARGLAAGAPVERLPLLRHPDREIGPLSFCEVGLFRLIRRDPVQVPYNLFIPLHVSEPPDPDRLRRAFAVLVERHENLRTGFSLIDGRPARRVSAHAEIPIEVLDLRGAPHAEREAAIRRAGDALRHHRFELDRPPLVRGTLLDFGGEGFLSLLFDHLIVDARSLAIIQRELAVVWRALGRGERPDLPPLPLRPADYAASSEAVFGPVFARGPAAFAPWPKDGYRLPLDAPMPAMPSHEGAFVRGVIDGGLWSRCKAAAAAADVPPAAAVITAFQAALHRHAGRGDVAFTVARDNRRQAEVQGLVASMMYGETFEGTLAEGDTWASLMARTRVVTVEQRLARMPYNMIVQPPSLRVNLNFHNFSVAAGDDTAPFTYAHENRYPYLWAVWDLFFQLLPVGDALLCEVLHRSEVLRRATVERIFTWVLEALEAIASDPFAPAVGWLPRG
jgi:alkylation response protein AidB-like acyl-CoA dehydrogenase/acyl carrier protein